MSRKVAPPETLRALKLFEGGPGKVVAGGEDTFFLGVERGVKLELGTGVASGRAPESTPKEGESLGLALNVARKVGDAGDCGLTLSFTGVEVKFLKARGEEGSLENLALALPPETRVGDTATFVVDWEGVFFTSSAKGEKGVCGGGGLLPTPPSLGDFVFMGVYTRGEDKGTDAPGRSSLLSRGGLGEPFSWCTTRLLVQGRAEQKKCREKGV